MVIANRNGCVFFKIRLHVFVRKMAIIRQDSYLMLEIKFRNYCQCFGNVFWLFYRKIYRQTSHKAWFFCTTTLISHIVGVNIRAELAPSPVLCAGSGNMNISQKLCKMTVGQWGKNSCLSLSPIFPRLLVARANNVKDRPWREAQWNENNWNATF